MRVFNNDLLHHGPQDNVISCKHDTFHQIILLINPFKIQSSIVPCSYSIHSSLFEQSYKYLSVGFQWGTSVIVFPTPS